MGGSSSSSTAGRLCAALPPKQIAVRRLLRWAGAGNVTDKAQE
jgi:hypothetical protein